MEEQTSCKSILLIEDDENILAALRELLESEGYSVVSSRNGSEALDLLRRIPRPCLILLDMFMPVMDGWEFLENFKLRKHDFVASVPIVITSAAGDRAREASEHVNGFIKKPYDLNALLQIVAEYCKKRLELKAA